MTRIVYVNGSYVRYEDASLHIEDRSVQFADSVYEVIEVRGKHLVDEAGHLQRLNRSLNELQMSLPMAMSVLGHIIRETIRRNKLRNGSVYIQVTRGAAPRDFIFPHPSTRQTVICIARASSPKKSDSRANTGISVVTTSDVRWQRPDIKTTGLLPNALARQFAHSSGADEAWLLDKDGFVTEGAASNAWIVTNDGVLQTRPADKSILRGITRSVVEKIAKAEGIALTKKAFHLDEALAAKEAFLTAATATIMPIVRIDGQLIGDGTPGPVTLQLRAQFRKYAETTA